MSSKKVFYVLAGVCALLALSLPAGTYAANSLLKARAKDLTDLKLSAAVLENKQTKLIKTKKDIEHYAPLAEIAKTVVPRDKDQALTVREIVKIAEDNNVPVVSISFPSSTLGSGPKSAGSAPASDPSAPTPKTNLSQLLPVTDMLGTYYLQITVQNDQSHPTTYANLINFLAGLENNRRTALIKNLTITPSPQQSSELAYSLTLEEYIKP